MMINYLGSPGRLTLHDDLNYGRKTKLPDARRARRNERRIRVNLSEESAEMHNHAYNLRGFRDSFYLFSARMIDKWIKKKEGKSLQYIIEILIKHYILFHKMCIALFA